MDHRTFSPLERGFAFIAGSFNLVIGLAFFLLATQREWARVRPLAIVAVVYGTIVALALLYHLLLLHDSPLFWFYFLFDVPFLIVFYALFTYHDIWPYLKRRKAQRPEHRKVAGSTE